MLGLRCCELALSAPGEIIEASINRNSRKARAEAQMHFVRGRLLAQDGESASQTVQLAVLCILCL